MSGTRESEYTARDTDPLLRPGRGHSPAYGLQNESEEGERSLESGKTSFQSICHPGERVFRVATCCLIACLASLLVGMALGFSSATLYELDNPDSTEMHNTKINEMTKNMFAAFLPLGAVFGGLFAWPVTELLGRQPALMVGGLPAICGWLFITYARLLNYSSGPSSQPTDGFIAFLLLGRLFTGFATGWSIFCVSVYISEVASAKFKGLFGNCNQLFITIGTLIAYGLGVSQDLHYYNIALVAAGVVAVFEILMLCTYESPRWLFKKATSQMGIRKSETEKEANRILNTLRGPEYDVPKEIRGIKRALDQNLTLVEQFIQLKHRSVYIPFILVLFLMFFQQFSGINAAIFFTATIFQQAQVPLPPTLVTFFAVGIVQVVATVVSVLVVDWRGRKQLLVVSSVGMCASSALLGAYFYILNDWCGGCFGNTTTTTDCPPHASYFHGEHDFCNNSSLGTIAIVGVIIFIVAFSLAWGPIPWTSMSELVPGRVKSLYASIASMVNWSFAVIITACFQPYSLLVTPKFAWWSFSIVMFVSIFFVVIFLPEAKGHSLEQIEDHFENGKILAITCKCSLCKKQPGGGREDSH